jgi:hypothetical protein
VHNRGQDWLRLLGALLIIASHSAPAQEQEGLSLGQLKILPTIGITWAHDDNITQASDQNVSSSFYVVSPGIRLEAPTDRSLFELTWEAEWGRYEASAIDDYDDWGLRAAWDYDPTTRTNLGLFADYGEHHDRRGEGRSQGDAGLVEFDPDEYELVSFGGYIDFGSVGSRGRLELEAMRSERKYQNNREQTRFLDRGEEHLEGVFMLRIRPKTAMLVGLGITDIDYDFTRQGQASLNSEETHFYVGIDWDATARTSGRIEFGWLEKEFDDPFIEGYDSSFWRIGLDWSPRTYSRFSLVASRETDESDGFGAYVLNETVSLEWQHNWTTRFNTHLEFGVGTNDHRPDFREDDLEFWGIQGRWQLNEHFQLGVGLQGYSRRSGLLEYDYDRKVWLITLEGSL